MNLLTMKFAAALLCVGSLVCSVALWVSEQTTLAAMVLAGVFATALELCKFAFFPVANQVYKTHHIAGVSLFGLSVLLLFLSIAATVAFMETGTQRKQTVNKQSSTVYQTMKRSLHSVEQEVDTVNEQIKRDIDYGYRQRALNTRSELAELKKERDKLVRDLSDYQEPAKMGAHAIFQHIAYMGGMTPKTIRLSFYSVIAILVDVCGIACLLLVGHFKPQKQALTKSNVTENCEKTESIRETIVDSKRQQIETIKKQVLSGEYGQTPGVRKIMAALKVKHATLKIAFDELINEGKITKSGQRFQLILKSQN